MGLFSFLGGGSDSTNDDLVKQQQREAAEAERREQERQARLDYGRNKIEAMFSLGGGEVTGPAEWGVTGQKQTGTQPIYETQTTPASYNPAGASFDYSSGFQRQDAQPGGTYTPASTQQVQVGSNPIYKDVEGWIPGETEQVEGIDQTFYDNFKNAITGYYRPEVDLQYGEAQSANLFDLARRGLLKSSQAVDNASELVREKALADAQVTANAENQTAGLRTDMSRAQQNALGLLQATEDPTTAANSALTEVNAITSRAPQFSPLGDLFSAAARGYNAYQQGETNRRLLDAIPINSPYASMGRTIG